MLPDYTHFFEHRKHVREDLNRIVQREKRLPWALYYPNGMAQEEGIGLCIDEYTGDLSTIRPSVEDRWYVLPGAEYRLPSVPSAFSTQRYSLVPIYHNLSFQDEIAEAFVCHAQELSDVLVKQPQHKQLYRHRLDLTFQIISMIWASRLLEFPKGTCQITGLATGVYPDKDDYARQIDSCVKAMLDFHPNQKDDDLVFVVIDGQDATLIPVAQLTLNSPDQVVLLAFPLDQLPELGSGALHDEDDFFVSAHLTIPINQSLQQSDNHIFPLWWAYSLAGDRQPEMLYDQIHQLAHTIALADLESDTESKVGVLKNLTPAHMVDVIEVRANTWHYVNWKQRFNLPYHAAEWQGAGPDASRAAAFKFAIPDRPDGDVRILDEEPPLALERVLSDIGQHELIPRIFLAVLEKKLDPPLDNIRRTELASRSYVLSYQLHAMNLVAQSNWLWEKSKEQLQKALTMLKTEDENLAEALRLFLCVSEPLSSPKESGEGLTGVFLTLSNHLTAALAASDGIVSQKQGLESRIKWLVGQKDIRGKLSILRDLLNNYDPDELSAEDLKQISEHFKLRRFYPNWQETWLYETRLDFIRLFDFSPLFNEHLLYLVEVLAEEGIATDSKLEQIQQHQPQLALFRPWEHHYITNIYASVVKSLDDKLHRKTRVSLYVNASGTRHYRANSEVELRFNVGNWGSEAKDVQIALSTEQDDLVTILGSGSQSIGNIAPSEIVPVSFRVKFGNLPQKSQLHADAKLTLIPRHHGIETDQPPQTHPIIFRIIADRRPSPYIKKPVANFITRGDVDKPEKRIGTKELLDEAQFFEGEQSWIVYGSRQTGKSTLLKEIFQTARAERADRYVPIYMNLQGILPNDHYSRPEIFKCILSEVHAAIAESLHPEAVDGDARKISSKQLDAEYWHEYVEGQGEEQFLTEWFEYLTTKCLGSSRKLLILIDEYDRVRDIGGHHRNMSMFLRSLESRNRKRVRWVLAFTKLYYLERFFSTSPWWNAFDNPRTVAAFTEEEIRAFDARYLGEPFTGQREQYRAYFIGEALNQLTDRVGRERRYVQLVFRMAMIYLNRLRRQNWIDMSDVPIIIEQIRPYVENDVSELLKEEAHPLDRPILAALTDTTLDQYTNTLHRVRQWIEPRIQERAGGLIQNTEASRWLASKIADRLRWLTEVLGLLYARGENYEFRVPLLKEILAEQPIDCDELAQKLNEEFDRDNASQQEHVAIWQQATLDAKLFWLAFIDYDRKAVDIETSRKEAASTKIIWEHVNTLVKAEDERQNWDKYVTHLIQDQSLSREIRQQNLNPDRSDNAVIILAAEFRTWLLERFDNEDNFREEIRAIIEQLAND